MFQLYIWYTVQSSVNIFFLNWFSLSNFCMHNKLFCALEKLFHMRMGINALLFLVLYNLFPLCITSILLWKKWEYGCTWIKRDLFAQNQMFLVVIPLISRHNVHFNTSSATAEKPWYEMGWWHSSFVHCPICQIQRSIKKDWSKKYFFQNVAFIRAVCHLSRP